VLGAAALVTLGATSCAFALTRGGDAQLAAIAADYTPPQLGTGASSTPTPTATGIPHPHVVVLGDTYAAPGGAHDAGHGFPALLGDAEGWDVDVISCAGAGYATPGTCGSDYAGLIPRIVAAKPDRVIVTGGRYDVGRYQSSAAAANAFFTQLAMALPDTPVFAISPVWDASHAKTPLGVVQQSVSAAAAAHGATYVDIGEPLRDHPELIAADGVLPNDAGSTALAQAIEQALRAVTVE
jgi:hypothetical protein